MYSLLNNIFLLIHMFLPKETICVTVAKTQKLNATKFGWLYDGCNFCTMGVKMDNGKLLCNRKHENDNPKPRWVHTIKYLTSF